MAKKKAPLPTPPTVEELRANAIARLHEWDRTPRELIPQSPEHVAAIQAMYDQMS